MPHIYHITTRQRWESSGPTYTAPTQEAEGFIHCSTREQVEEVANRIFKGQQGLVLLTIDPDKVSHEIVYENLEGGSEQYPHIYGPLERDAVIAVMDFVPNAEGNFDFWGD